MHLRYAKKHAVLKLWIPCIKYQTTLNAFVQQFFIDIDDDYKDAYAVKFKSSGSESLVISLAPDGLIYSTNSVPKDIVETSVEIYMKFKNGVAGKNYEEVVKSYDDVN